MKTAHLVLWPVLTCSSGKLRSLIMKYEKKAQNIMREILALKLKKWDMSGRPVFKHSKLEEAEAKLAANITNDFLLIMTERNR